MQKKVEMPFLPWAIDKLLSEVRTLIFEAFSNCEIIELEVREIELSERLYHNGVGLLLDVWPKNDSNLFSFYRFFYFSQLTNTVNSPMEFIIFAHNYYPFEFYYSSRFTS